MSKARVEVYGVADAMRHMRTYEKELYKTVSTKMRNSAQPLASAVGGDFPERALTNWRGSPAKSSSGKRPFPAYEAANVRGMVKPKVGVGRVSASGQRNILRIQQMSPGGAVFDSAGSRTSNMFVKNLDRYAPTKGTSRRGALRSRVMYKAVDKRMPMVESVVSHAISLTDKMVQAAINARGRA
jgi:hypothetical protein